MKTKSLWNRDAKVLLAFVLLMALLQGAAIYLWNWCDQSFMELMLGNGQGSGDPEVWKNQLRHWQVQSEAVVLKGYPVLFALLLLGSLFRKIGRWTPLLALPAGYAGAWLVAEVSRLWLGRSLLGILTLSRSAVRSALVLAIGYLLLWLADWWKRRRTPQA